MFDHHLHVWPHGPGTPTPTFEQLEEYCDAAVANGIEQIAITEHSYRFTRIVTEVLPLWNRPRTGALAEATDRILDIEGGGDLDAYVAALLAAKERGLPLLIGLEVDYMPGAVEAMADMLGEYPFDILLGSVHWLDDWLFDAYDIAAFGKRWDERDVDDVYAQYVDSIIDLAQSGLADVLAHLDVIKVAGHVPSRPTEHEDRLVAALLDTDITIEFSSAGLGKPVNDTYPSERILRRLVDGGIGLTTASDAHTVGQVGKKFDRLRVTLDDLGVEELTTFERRIEHRRPV